MQVHRDRSPAIQRDAAGITGAGGKHAADLQHEVHSLRKQYDKARDKAGSLRTALKTARQGLAERDRQLAAANRGLDRLATDRDTAEVRHG